VTKKEAILKAAQIAFSKTGFASTTVKDVASLANVSFGLVSHYFGSKSELFLVAGFDMADRLIIKLTEATADAPNGLEGVLRYMTAYFKFTEEHRESFPVLLRCSPFSLLEPGVNTEKVAQKFTVFIDELKRCIALGIQDGTIRDLPLRETALIIYGNVVGSVRTSLLSPYETGNMFTETINHVERSLVNMMEQAAVGTSQIPKQYTKQINQ